VGLDSFLLTAEFTDIEYNIGSERKIEMKGEIMDVMNVVAVVGAAAWTPQIISWIYRFFTKPILSIYLHSEPEVGYTTYGPIFNISCALLSKHKDAVLNKFSVILRHESGASYNFDWIGLSEDVSEILNPIGPPMSIRKTSLPLVVKVLHTGVAQMFVRFLHESFRLNLRKATIPALERFNFLKTSGKLKTEDDIDKLVSEQQFDEVMKVFESEFIWRNGKYIVTFEFESPNKYSYKKTEYTFELKHEDIEELKKNLDNIRLDVIQKAKSEIISGFESKPIKWIWRNPELRKKEKIELISG